VPDGGRAAKRGWEVEVGHDMEVRPKTNEGFTGEGCNFRAKIRKEQKNNK
jgi:hypothetical protein